MGISLLASQTSKMFRFAVVACCVALATAEAEADAQYLTTSNLGHLGYSGLAGHAGVYSGLAGHAGVYAGNAGYAGVYAAPTVAATYAAPMTTYAGQTAGVYAGHHAGVYAGHVGHAGVYAAPATTASIAVRGYGTPATIGTYQPYGYAASGRYVADSVGAVHVAKRSADAEAEPEAQYGYSNLGHMGYSGLTGYAGAYGRHAGVYAGHAGVYAGQAGVYAAPTVAATYAAPISTYAGVRSGLGYAGRLGYSGLGYSGLGYSGLGYGGAIGYRRW